MLPQEKIRNQIKRLYETAPVIHMNISLKKPRLELFNAQATITGVFPHIFQVEETTSGRPVRHTLQYNDVLIKNIVILEMEENVL